MEILGERPVWSMTGSEMLSSLDAAFAEIARLETFALHLMAGLETTGYAQELGAGTTARLLTFRYRIDPTKARRDVHLAKSLPKYPAVAAALPNPHHTAADPADEDETGETGENGAGADGAGADDAGDDGAGADGACVGVLLHPGQAEAIVAALDKVPATVPVDDLRVAEREMVELGRTHGPLDLRKAGVLVRNRLDTDGPEPKEQKAYDRESLTLKNTDQGVDFRGYLANENAELLRALIHAHAKPHKTIDGALDPRPRSKRQADALTTLLTAANNPTATATATTRSGTAAPGTRGAPGTAATDATGASGGHRHRTTTTRADTTDPAGTAAGAGPAGTPDTGAANDDLADTLPGISTDTDPAAAGTTSSAAAAAAGPSTAGGTTGASTGTGGGTAGAGRASGFIPGHGPKAHITVTIDFNDLKAATADKLGHLIYGDALSAATIRRLACDAQILPVVLGSDSQPLDVGTTIRLATGPIRNALITRDKGCVCCGAPPIYCDAHHVVHWIDGGATKLTNLALLCKRCHRDLHAGHWTIRITHGIVHVARPGWATPDPIPHGRYRPPTTTNSGPPTAGSTTGSSTTRGTAGATIPGGTGGGSARVWPRETDPPWITPEDAARLNPWGDAPDERPSRRPARPPAADFNPWGDAPDEQPTRTQPRPPADDFNPWGDAPDEQPTRTQPRPPADDFNPWGDAPDEQPTRTQPRPPAADVNPWGDAPDERPSRRQKVPPGGDFEPWGDRCGDGAAGVAQQSAVAGIDPWDDACDEQPSRTQTPPPAGGLDPWADSTEPHGTTTAAATITAATASSTAA